MIADCAYTDPDELEKAANREVPDPYYFERGDHRDDLSDFTDPEGCIRFFVEQLTKERDDIIKGFLEYNHTCVLAMVKLGRVNNSFVCSADGELLIADCKLASPTCDSCFPCSRCGTNDDKSNTFVESHVCGSDLATCALGTNCFDHKGGICA